MRQLYDFEKNTVFYRSDRPSEIVELTQIYDLNKMLVFCWSNPPVRPVLSCRGLWSSPGLAQSSPVLYSGPVTVLSCPLVLFCLPVCNVPFLFCTMFKFQSECSMFKFQDGNSSKQIILQCPFGPYTVVKDWICSSGAYM